MFLISWHSISISLYPKTKKNKCSCLFLGGHRFFIWSGAPLWYSHRSPSRRSTTEAHPLILTVIILLPNRYSQFPASQTQFQCHPVNSDRFPSFVVSLDEDPNRQTLVAVRALLDLLPLLKNCIRFLYRTAFKHFVSKLLHNNLYFLWLCLQWKECWWDLYE